jgi:hypothetical protein
MAAIAVAGVGLMVVCSSSVAAAMMMGGDGDDDSSGSGGGGGGGGGADDSDDDTLDPDRVCPRTVSAQRTDANGGWGMNLRFKCGDETAEIGNGTANKMTTPTPININEISCPGTVSKANWLGTDTYPDKFAITVSDCQ